MFDTIGTVIAVLLKAGMVDKDGRVDGMSQMLMADAVATTAGACLGTSTTTTYVESANLLSCRPYPLPTGVEKALAFSKRNQGRPIGCS